MLYFPDLYIKKVQNYQGFKIQLFGGITPRRDELSRKKAFMLSHKYSLQISIIDVNYFRNVKYEYLLEAEAGKNQTVATPTIVTDNIKREGNSTEDT